MIMNSSQQNETIKKENQQHMRMRQLDRALNRVLASNREVKDLLVKIDGDPALTPMQRQLIQQARFALQECSGSLSLTVDRASCQTLGIASINP